MVPGEISRKRNVVGTYLPDPFYDNYREEANTVTDIMNLVDRIDCNFVTVTIDKLFLKKMAKSHLFHIQNMEKFAK